MFGFNFRLFFLSLSKKGAFGWTGCGNIRDSTQIFKHKSNFKLRGTHKFYPLNRSYWILAAFLRSFSLKLNSPLMLVIVRVFCTVPTNCLLLKTDSIFSHGIFHKKKTRFLDKCLSSRILLGIFLHLSE